MKRAPVIQAYGNLQPAMGSRVHSAALILNAFARTVGDITMAEVTAEHVTASLAGHGPVSRFWHRQHSA